MYVEIVEKMCDTAGIGILVKLCLLGVEASHDSEKQPAC